MSQEENREEKCPSCRGLGFFRYHALTALKGI